MITRLKFAAIAGIVGLVLGCILAAIIKKDGEAFPIYVIIACSATFALCGAIAKKEWMIDAITFFITKVP